MSKDFEGEVYLRPAEDRVKVIDGFRAKRVAVDQIVQLLPEISTRRYIGVCQGACRIMSGSQNTALSLKLDSGSILVFPSTGIRAITTVRGGYR